MANGEGTPEDAVMSMVDGDLLDELLGTLDRRARYAVEARFGLLDGERKSFREVGESLGVTAEAARRLVHRAVASLRDPPSRSSPSNDDSKKEEIPPPYLGHSGSEPRRRARDLPTVAGRVAGYLVRRRHGRIPYRRRGCSSSSSPL